VERLNIVRKSGHNPLFDVMFTLDNLETDESTAQSGGEGEETPEYQLNNRIARADMTWVAIEEQGQLYFSVEYASKLFMEETIKRFIGFFEEISKTVIKDKHIQLKDIQLSDNLVDIEAIEFPGDFEL
jgi:non-ribosomal peptide synthetase component F